MRYFILVALFVAAPLWAEPYLAVDNGLTCGTCHVNQTGGGMRNTFGNIFAQQQLTVRPLGAKDSPWTGVFGNRFGFGADARMAARQIDIDGQDNSLDFTVDRVTLYGSATLNEYVMFYLDQRVAPGGSFNREAWAKFNFGKWYAKAGKLFLPYGWRLEDDTEFVRTATGINMTGGDNGVEFGFQGRSFNAQLAVTNGSGGGPEVDDGKLFTLRGEWVRSRWRVGASAQRNDTDVGDRSSYGVFAGLKTGMVSWLFEYDRIEDEFVGLAKLEQDAALIEANIMFKQGHNLKITGGMIDFDDNRDDQFRTSIVYEYFPFVFTQFRIGFRKADSDDPDPRVNGDEAFVQAHVFF